MITENLERGVVNFEEIGLKIEEKLYIISFQCSKQSEASGIQNRFERAVVYQEANPYVKFTLFFVLISLH